VVRWGKLLSGKEFDGHCRKTLINHLGVKSETLRSQTGLTVNGCKFALF
jgi:hypothetical protein